ncbi:MAG: hypothetical protein WB989_29680, partial [Mycobacterium sp.]
HQIVGVEMSTTERRRIAADLKRAAVVGPLPSKQLYCNMIQFYRRSSRGSGCESRDHEERCARRRNRRSGRRWIPLATPVARADINLECHPGCGAQSRRRSRPDEKPSDKKCDSTQGGGRSRLVVRRHWQGERFAR